MLNWKEQSVANKSILINRNGDYESPKVLHMDPDWGYIDFLNAASNRLFLVPSAKRVFDSNGVEINDCMMIEDNDRLFLSQGEDFLSPKVTVEKKHHDNSVDPLLDGKQSKEKAFDKHKFSISTIGPYSVGEVLGRGGFGEVREGTNQVTGEKVALKFIRKSDIQSMGAVEKAAVEIKCQTILRHNNIIKLEMNMETSKYVVLAFELMRGGDLFKYLCDKGPTAADATLTESDARLVFQQVVAGVSYAHNNNIIHRDLKLDNILLKDKSLNHVKIADFGLSEFYRPGGTLSSTSGTLSFQAPEVISGSNHAGPPLDVWAMGVILFTMLCGRLPFEGVRLNMSKRPREAIIKDKIIKCQYRIDESLSTESKDLVRRMLALDPLKRASIPDIVGHRWMRSELYGRRVSSALIAVPSGPSLSGNMEDEVSECALSGALTAPIQADSGVDTESPPPPSSGPLESSKVGTSSSSNSRMQSAVDNLYSRFTADGEPIVSNSVGAGSRDESIGSVSCDTQSISNIGNSNSSCSNDSAIHFPSSFKMRFPTPTPSDQQEGAALAYPATVTPLLSCASTPLATPRALPRPGYTALGPDSLSVGSPDSLLLDFVPTDTPKLRSHEVEVGNSPRDTLKFGAKTTEGGRLMSDSTNRRFSDLGCSHSSLGVDGTPDNGKSVPLFQLVPLRRKVHDWAKQGGVGVHSRSCESDSEDTVASCSTARDKETARPKSPSVPRRKRSDSTTKSVAVLPVRGKRKPSTRSRSQSRPQPSQVGTPSDLPQKHRVGGSSPVAVTATPEVPMARQLEEVDSRHSSYSRDEEEEEDAASISVASLSGVEKDETVIKIADMHLCPEIGSSSCKIITAASTSSSVSTLATSSCSEKCRLDEEQPTRGELRTRPRGIGSPI